MTEAAEKIEATEAEETNQNPELTFPIKIEGEAFERLKVINTRNKENIKALVEATTKAKRDLWNAIIAETGIEANGECSFNDDFENAGIYFIEKEMPSLKKMLKGVFGA